MYCCINTLKHFCLDNRAVSDTVAAVMLRHVVAGDAIAAVEVATSSSMTVSDLGHAALHAGLAEASINPVSVAFTTGAENRDSGGAVVLFPNIGGDTPCGKERGNHPEVCSGFDSRSGQAMGVVTSSCKSAPEGEGGKSGEVDHVTCESANSTNPGEDHEDNHPCGDLGKVFSEAMIRESADSDEEPDKADGEIERTPEGVEDGDKDVAGVEAPLASDELGKATPYHDEREEVAWATIPPVGEPRRDYPGAAGICSQAKGGGSCDWPQKDIHVG